MPAEAVRYRDGAVELIDQTLLPGRHEILKIRDLETLCEAIYMLRVRGAPAIGVTAAHGMRMVADAEMLRGVSDLASLRQTLEAAAERLNATRPTARNLFMATERMLRVVRGDSSSVPDLVAAITTQAEAIHEEDRKLCLAIARNGAELLPQRANVLTHCNAGALATGGIGTALGVVYEAVRQGKIVQVFADETRPLLQGARLTAWELEQEGIPVTLLCDNAAASLLSSGDIDCVVVGADRIARNGDTANKIGTLSVAIAARQFGIPFYVAAPSTTFDLSLATGAEIPIEKRAAQEVSESYGKEVTPPGIGVFNPAFDVTPNALITAIVHEFGVVRPPFVENVPTSLSGA